MIIRLEMHFGSVPALNYPYAKPQELCQKLNDSTNDLQGLNSPTSPVPFAPQDLFFMIKLSNNLKASLKESN